MKKLILATIITTLSFNALAVTNTNQGVNSISADSSNIQAIGDGNNVTSSQNINSMGTSNNTSGSQNTTVVGDNNRVTNASDSNISGSANTVSGSSNTVSGNNNNVTSNNGVAIGSGNTVSGEGSIAIGGGNASNGGIAIGSGSNASKADEVNFGDRNITGIKEGVAGTDGVNVNQLNNKASETLNNANNYTDSKVPTIINEANNYTDYQYNQAVNQLFNKNKAYIDSQAYRLDKKIDNNFQKASGGIAGAMAMASIPKKEGFRTSWGIGVANFKSQQAIAGGVEHNTTDRTVVKFNFSSDTKGGVGVGAGFAFGSN